MFFLFCFNQSDDPSVFFFSNKKNVRTPIGFVNLPSPVTYMTWTPTEYVRKHSTQFIL